MEQISDWRGQTQLRKEGPNVKIDGLFQCLVKTQAGRQRRNLGHSQSWDVCADRQQAELRIQGQPRQIGISAEKVQLADLKWEKDPE